MKISSDMPLPMPLSVTSSPSHMTRPVPAVMVSTMMTRVGIESSGRMLVQVAPNRLCGFWAKVISVEDCSTARPMVR